MVAVAAQFGSLHQAFEGGRHPSITRLHSYQSTALQLSYDYWGSQIRRQMIVLPTGTGKTVLFAVLPIFYRFPGRILVLVHRDTLAEQAKKTIEEWYPDAGPVGIEMGQQHSDGERVVVASVQTIGMVRKTKDKHGRTISVETSKRLKKFNPDEFDAVIVDECHHSVAPGYKYIFQHFGFLDEKLKKTNPAPKRLLFGVTATPKRLDGEMLNQIYDKKVFEYPIEDAIREGWLVNPRAYRIRTEISLAAISLSDDELDKLAAAVNTPERNKLIVDKWMEKAAGRKTICFGVDVQHTKDLAKAFRKAKIKAQAVWGGDPDKDQKLADFKKGKIQVLCNCMLLTEGYDDRSISCVVLARPTDSESLFKQMVGRAMRLPEGVLNLLQAIAKKQVFTKHDCIILDILDAGATEHSLAMSFAQAYGLPDEFDLEGAGLLEAKDKLNRLRPRAERHKETEEELKSVKSMSELSELVSRELKASEEEIDLLRVPFDAMVLENSQLQWHKSGEEYFILVLPDRLGSLNLKRSREGVMVLDGSRLEDVSKRFSVTGKIANGNFGDGFRFADNQVMRRFGSRVFDLCERNVNSSSWKSHPASPKQLAILKKFYEKRNLHVPDGVTGAEASLLITQMLAVRQAA